MCANNSIRHNIIIVIVVRVHLEFQCFHDKKKNRSKPRYLRICVRINDPVELVVATRRIMVLCQPTKTDTLLLLYRINIVNCVLELINELRYYTLIIKNKKYRVARPNHHYSWKLSLLIYLRADHHHLYNIILLCPNVIRV